MSLEVKKTFTISNKDAEVLSTICELARRYISKEKSQKPIQLIERKDLYVDEYSYEEIAAVQDFSTAIWE